MQRRLVGIVVAACALGFCAASTARAGDAHAAEGPKDAPRLGDAEPRTAPLARVHGPRVDGKAGAALAPAERVELGALDLVEARLAARKHTRRATKGAFPAGVVRRVLPVRAPDRMAGAKHAFETDDGTRVWSLEMRAKGALAVRARICACDLPAGSELVVFDADEPSEIYGPLAVPATVGADTPYWTPTVYGEALRIELRVPAGQADADCDFAVDGLVHRFERLDDGHDHDGAEAGEAGGGFKAGSCSDSVACDANYLGSLSRAVGRMSFVSGGFSYVCTGTLLSDQDESGFTPWFVTANHCISTGSEAASLEVLWDFHAGSCFGSPPREQSLPRTVGAALVATVGKNTGTDCTLLRLTGTLPSGRLFAGWTASSQADGSAVVAIHNPGGDDMRISYGNVLTKTTNFIEVDWTDGVVLPGSSGSGIFNASRQLVGTLCCGSSSCSFTQGTDDYGRFDRSWTLLGLDAYLATSGGGGGGGGGDEPVDEYDPTDDRRSGATIVGAPPPAGADHGPHTLSSTDTADWFAFDLVKGGDYVFESTSPEADTDVIAHLYDAAAGRPVARNDDGGDGLDFLLRYRARRTRRHYLRVRRFDSAASSEYTLTHRLETLAAAAVADLRHKFNRRGKLVLKWSDRARGEGGYVVQEFVGSEWVTQTELRKNSRRARLDRPADGEHLFRVGPWNARGVTYTELPVSVGTSPAGDAADPGDDVATGATTLVPAAGGTITGRVVGGNDAADWFEVAVDAGTEYVFESQSAGDLVAEAFMASSPTTVVATDDDSGPGLDFRLAFTPTASGTLRLKVRAFSSAESVAYALVWSSSIPPITPGGAFELTPAAGGQTGDFRLDANRTELWFRIEVTSGRDYFVESNGVGDTIGEWYGPTPNDLLATDDDSGAGLNFLLALSVGSSGTRWIRVRPFSPGATVTFSITWSEE